MNLVKLTPTSRRLLAISLALPLCAGFWESLETSTHEVYSEHNYQRDLPLPPSTCANTRCIDEPTTHAMDTSQGRLRGARSGGQGFASRGVHGSYPGSPGGLDEPQGGGEIRWTYQQEDVASGGRFGEDDAINIYGRGGGERRLAGHEPVDLPSGDIQWSGGEFNISGGSSAGSTGGTGGAGSGGTGGQGGGTSGTSGAGGAGRAGGAGGAGGQGGGGSTQGASGGAGASGAQGGQGSEGGMASQSTGGGQGSAGAQGAGTSPGASRPPRLTPPPKPTAAEPIPDPEEQAEQDASSILKILGILVAGVCLILFMVFFVKRIKERAGGSQAEDEASESEEPAGELLEELRALSEDREHGELAQEMRYDRAIHALLLSALTRVLVQQRELNAPSMTSRSILKGVHLDEASKRELELLIQGVELCVFARREATAPMYERCKQAHDAIMASLGTHGEVQHAQ